MLHVYSEKLQKMLGFDVEEKGKLVPVGAAPLSGPNIMFAWNDSPDGWVDNGWNNTADGWLDEGWNNSAENWQDNGKSFLPNILQNQGWLNDPDHWQDQGWLNDPDHWQDQGWSNNTDNWSDSSRARRGCFITTACVEQRGLADDCHEMQILRHYRDILVEKDDSFRSKVLEYYRKAPLIIHEIESREDSRQVYNDLYDEMISPCINLLEEGKIEEAKVLYLNYYERLSKEYLAN